MGAKIRPTRKTQSEEQISYESHQRGAAFQRGFAASESSREARRSSCDGASETDHLLDKDLQKRLSASSGQRSQLRSSYSSMDLGGGGGSGGAIGGPGAAVAPASQQLRITTAKQQEQQQQQPSETMRLRKKSQSSSQSSIDSENLYKKNLTFGQLFKRSIIKNVLLVSTIGAVFLGTLIGLVIRNSSDTKPSEDLVQLMGFPGDMFLRMLKMLILPLIIASVISALASLDTTVSGKVGMRACLLYLTTTVVATITGIILVTLIHPGDVKMKQSFRGNKG